MYELRIEQRFHAAHALRLYDGSMEPMHAHDWRVRVIVAARRLDQIEVVMDFHELERIVSAVVRPLGETTLNDLELLARINPSAERVAEHIYKGIAPHLPGHVRLERVSVTEAEGCEASFVAEGTEGQRDEGA